MAEYRAIASGRSTSLSGPISHRVRGGHVNDAEHAGEDGGRRGVRGYNPSINITSLLAAILHDQIRCDAERATET